MNDDKLQRIETPAMVEPLSQINLQVLMEKALTAQEGVAILERLEALRSKMLAEQSRKAFFRSLALFQSEVPVIKKSRLGAKNSYMYAPLDLIIEQVKPVLQKYGFSFVVTSEVTEGWVKAIIRITHELGHSEQSEFKCPLDTRATMMNAPQQYGAALTYAKRYCFCGAFGILTGDEDTDGMGKKPEKGPSSVEADRAELKPFITQIWAMLKGIRGTEANWIKANQWLMDQGIIADTEELPNVTIARAKEIITKLKKP